MYGVITEVRLAVFEACVTVKISIKNPTKIVTMELEREICTYLLLHCR